MLAPWNSATTGFGWYWCQGTQTSVSYWPQTSTTAIMFTPGTGALYYHAIPTNLAAISYPTTTSGSAVWQAEIVRPAAGRELHRPEPSRPAILRGRRALQRSLDLLRKFRPEGEVKAFLAGRPLIVRGHRFDYSMQKRGDLLRHTMNPASPHIPYDLHVLDKHSGQRLAKGCVVVPDAPVLDQLLAVILHVQDPDEENVVINTTHWSAQLPRRAMAD